MSITPTARSCSRTRGEPFQPARKQLESRFWSTTRAYKRVGAPNLDAPRSATSGRPSIPEESILTPSAPRSAPAVLHSGAWWAKRQPPTTKVGLERAAWNDLGTLLDGRPRFPIVADGGTSVRLLLGASKGSKEKRTIAYLTQRRGRWFEQADVSFCLIRV